MLVKRAEIKLQPQFISSIYFHFTQKSKQAFYSGLALKTCSIKPGLKWFFFNFLFFKVFKALYINYINSKSITEHITL